jgi:membrane-associated phospholipid phosphatase
MHRSAERRDGLVAWKAAATAAGLSTLFFIVYPLCNWLASRRGHVSSFYFGWEKSIPFVPVFIIPYASINLFFVGAPFLAKSERELRTLTKRIVLAMLISDACFVLIPLRFAFPVPAVGGTIGALFDALHGFDRPFNEFPSLHVAFCVIVANVYLRRAPGILWGVILVWFVLIVASTLLTYQHHFVDVLGGLAVGFGCIGMVRGGQDFRKDSDRADRLLKVDQRAGS